MFTLKFLYISITLTKTVNCNSRTIYFTENIRKQMFVSNRVLNYELIRTQIFYSSSSLNAISHFNDVWSVIRINPLPYIYSLYRLIALMAVDSYFQVTLFAIKGGVCSAIVRNDPLLSILESQQNWKVTNFSIQNEEITKTRVL